MLCTSAAVIVISVSATWTLGRSGRSRERVQSISTRMSATLDEAMGKLKSCLGLSTTPMAGGIAMPMGKMMGKMVMGDVMIAPSPSCNAPTVPDSP
jgi:hypothetical protein